MKRFKVIFLFALVTVIGCEKGNESFFPYQSVSIKDISINNITIDTLRIIPPSSSYVIESGIFNDNIYLFDRYYCTMLTFDKEGNFLCENLGQGRGPKETPIGRIISHGIFQNGDFVLLGSNLDHYLYNKDCETINMFTLMPNEDKNINIEDNPYTYTHLYNDMVCRTYNDKVYFSVRAEHPELNHLDHTSDFLNKSCNILEVDIYDQTKNKVLSKGYPDHYKKQPYNNVILSGVNFDVDHNGNFYISYEADSMIYCYDKNFKPINCFGYSGVNMDLNYVPITNYSDSRKNYRNERNKKGYYYWVEYEEQTSLLFRTYKKGEQEISDGLQIYNTNKLIADVDIPKNMRVMGYIAPYYYSYVISDEDQETMILYRFKL